MWLITAGGATFAAFPAVYAGLFSWLYPALFLLLFSSSLIQFYTELLWFQSLDYAAIFTTRLWAAVGMGVVGFLITGACFIINWSLIPYWLFPKKDWSTQIRGQEVTVPTRPLRIGFTLASLLLALGFGLSLGGRWSAYLLAHRAVDFGLRDPIFGMDMSFYVFQLPWYQTVLASCKTLLAFIFVGLLLRYAIFQQVQKRGAIAHLSLVGALWLLLLSVGQLLARFTLLQSHTSVVFGAGYTDVNARNPIYIVEAIIFACAALLLVVNAFARRGRLLALAGLAWLIMSVIAGLYPLAVQRLTVEPNEFVVEKPFIEHNIYFTRYAYGLDHITEYDYPGAGTITQADLAANADILQNVRLWDYRPLLRTYGQLQEIRLYYTFNDIDVDRYMLDGHLRQVMLAARELDVDELADQAQTWVNRHLIFTHGYGLALNLASEVGTEGLPRLLMRDIPPTTAAPELALSRPELYFGESTHDYIIVNTTEAEFDYPQGDANAYTRYAGPDGVPLGSFFRRLALALRFNSVQLLLSPALTDESRILYHRNITERARAIAPMLWYDPDPYPIIANGRIVWLLDAYTWTDHFPYSEPVNRVNYLRNSVKVTVDAYTGEIIFYLIDPSDPVAATYARIFPDLFASRAAVPAPIQEHWRYPEMLFQYQSHLYATYHMRDPQVFYNREDLWDIPQELVETQQQTMEPYYVVTRLPDSAKVEFMLIRPYVPAQKQNMVAWLYADSDGEDYGQLGAFKLAKDRLIYGPLQVEARTDQDPVISQQLTLWNQRGSRVLRGNLLVIPIQDAFLYVEPLYLEAESGQLPELKRIIVAYNDQVAMAPTLAEALLQVLGGAPVAPSESPGGDLETLAQQAWEHYQAAETCLQAGDWACYGQEQAALEQTLKAMVGE